MGMLFVGWSRWRLERRKDLELVLELVAVVRAGKMIAEVVEGRRRTEIVAVGLVAGLELGMKEKRERCSREYLAFALVVAVEGVVEVGIVVVVLVVAVVEKGRLGMPGPVVVSLLRRGRFGRPDWDSSRSCSDPVGRFPDSSLDLLCRQHLRHLQKGRQQLLHFHQLLSQSN